MKETIIQFGEGVFLRGFVDYFVQKMHTAGVYDGKIVVVQPIEKGRCDELNRVGCRYNLFLRGISNGKEVCERTEVHSISRCVNPYADFSAFLALAHNPDCRVVVSNTTEAGIAYSDADRFDDAPPASFPAKVTRLLYERYRTGLGGFLFLPCELIDNNADRLRECVLRYAALWNLGEEFVQWVQRENTFANTLVDRITTGYPTEEAAELEKQIGYADPFLDTAEIFHLWVIQGNFEHELPLQHAGINVVWTDDVTPYKKRKVRILNGAHTSMVLAGHLYGLTTVLECMQDPVMHEFLSRTLFDEIIPTLGNSETDIQFGKDVLERFRNPFIHHKLLAIALNSVSKFRVRVLPSLLAYRDMTGKNPPHLTFSLAALIAFYRTDAVNDVPEVAAFLREHDTAQILANAELWGCDLTMLLGDVSAYEQLIAERGIGGALACIKV